MTESIHFTRPQFQVHPEIIMVTGSSPPVCRHIWHTPPQLIGIYGIHEVSPGRFLFPLPTDMVVRVRC